MRRLGLVIGGCFALSAVAVVTLAAGGSSWRSLRLRTPARATPGLTAVVSDGSGSRLEQIEPATFASVRTSRKVAYYDGWVRSPRGNLIAVSTNPDSNVVTYSTLHFATVSSLRWLSRGVRLGGYFDAAIWPRPDTLYALVGSCCGPGLAIDTVDVPARKIVSRTQIPGFLPDIVRSATGLVLLEASKANAIAPARLVAIDADGSVCSLHLQRILDGTHFDQSRQDPIGTIRQPALAVDESGGIAYVLDPDGLVATVHLRDLHVTYHQVATGSLLAALSGWLTPTAQAKGFNGPILAAQWLGHGLVALTGSDYSAIQHKNGGFFSSIGPAGLRIVDTRNWSVHMLDPQANSMLVADGVLLASGGSSHSNSSGSTSSGEGVVAYNPDGSIRWRLDPGVQATLIAAYGNRALVQRFDTSSNQSAPLQLVDLANGHVVRRLPADISASLLLGSGSEEQ